MEKLKEGLEYEGVRVKFVARLENARTAIQVDVGFGDAVRATFGRRNTELSSGNLAKLLNELADDASKQTQWRAFLRKSSLIVEDDLAAANRAIHDFLVPLAGGEIIGGSTPIVWEPVGPWLEAKANGS